MSGCLVCEGLMVEHHNMTLCVLRFKQRFSAQQQRFNKQSEKNFIPTVDLVYASSFLLDIEEIYKLILEKHSNYRIQFFSSVRDSWENN